MDQGIVGAPTSSAMTSDTEPEVVAGIASGKGSPNRRLWIRVEGAGPGIGRMLLLAAGGLALGFGLTRLLYRGRG